MSNNRLNLATTANGKKVYVSPRESHAATHLLESPQLLDLIKEFLPTIVAKDENIYVDKDMGRIVGLTDLVETGADDEIVYAKRLNRSNYTRFVKNRKAQPTSYVTVVLKKDTQSDYELWSAWIGPAVPQFPGDEYETVESRPFWRQHALVWGNQQIQIGSELQEWPWGSDNDPSKTSRTSSTSKSQSSSSKV